VRKVAFITRSFDDFNEGRRQEAGGCFCNRDLGSPLQKLFALKGEVLDPIFSIIYK
jgi:hypothetical protein